MICKKLLATAVALFMVLSTIFTATAKEADTKSSLKSTIDSALSYKRSQCSASNNDEFISILSKSCSDIDVWYYIILSMYGINCQNSESITALKKQVDTYYQKGLENTKVTDMQRTALALLSCDTDITNVSGHNLLADCTYNRELYAPLDKQGVNGLAYALILLDSKAFKIPEKSALNRKDIINKILSKQLEKGGFAITGSNPDVDITAIVLQSLAPYKSDSSVEKSVNTCLEYLSRVQQSNGSYKSYGNETAESTAQVLIALTSLKINPYTDNRFVKNGNTAVDGLLTFLNTDGGFSHIKGYGSDNIATIQGLCGLISCYRYLNGNSRFYSFTQEKTTVKPTELATVSNKPTKANKKKPHKKTESIKIKVENSTEPTDTKATEAATEKVNNSKKENKSQQLTTAALTTEKSQDTAIYKPKHNTHTYTVVFTNQTLMTYVLINILILSAAYIILVVSKLKEKKK